VYKRKDTGRKKEGRQKKGRRGMRMEEGWRIREHQQTTRKTWGGGRWNEEERGRRKRGRRGAKDEAGRPR
jgi:hypothetical protein